MSSPRAKPGPHYPVLMQVLRRADTVWNARHLLQRKLVERRDADQDRRAWRAVLTPADQRLSRQRPPYNYQAAEEVQGDLPPSQAGVWVKALAALCANAQPGAAALASIE